MAPDRVARVRRLRFLRRDVLPEEIPLLEVMEEARRDRARGAMTAARCDDIVRELTAQRAARRFEECVGLWWHSWTIATVQLLAIPVPATTPIDTLLPVVFRPGQFITMEFENRGSDAEFIGALVVDNSP